MKIIIVGILVLSFFAIVINTKLTAPKNSIFSFNTISLQRKLREAGKKSDLNYSFKSNARKLGSASDNSIIYQGWLKIIEINEDAGEVPKTFEKNSAYNQQSDSNGFNYIPGENYFYTELTANNLNVFDKKDTDRQPQKTLNLSDLAPQGSHYKGGVEDVGNFIEGFCFMLKFRRFTKGYIWELCADTSSEKQNWLQKLEGLNKNAATDHLSPATAKVTGINTTVTLRPKAGIVTGVAPGFAIAHGWGACTQPCGVGVRRRLLVCRDHSICSEDLTQEEQCNLQPCRHQVESHLESLKKVADGHWKYLGDWSPCSKPCGGGVQSIHRQCIGAQCTGDTLLTQRCNLAPCGTDPNDIKISVSPIFERRAFDACRLLEGNLMMVVDNHKILSHVAINMQTVSIFSQNRPDSPIEIPISSLTNVTSSDVSPSCFTISDPGKKYVLCPKAEQEISCQTWVERILEFKRGCTNKLLTNFESDISSSVKNAQDPYYHQNKLRTIQDESLQNQKLSSAIKERALDEQFAEFKRQTHELVSREDQYEIKLESQEKRRIEQDEAKMKEEMLNEERVASKLLDDVQAIAGSDSAYKKKEMAIKREMKEMMNEVQEKINKKRQNLINKLERMRTLHKLEEKKNADRLLDMKRNLGKRFADFSKKGSPSLCFRRSPPAQAEYCEANVKDIDMQLECKNPKEFCYICCQNETGGLNQDDLNCCYNRCDQIESSKCTAFQETYLVHSRGVAMIN